jgi:hypothetical protein
LEEGEYDGVVGTSGDGGGKEERGNFAITIISRAFCLLLLLLREVVWGWLRWMSGWLGEFFGGMLDMVCGRMRCGVTGFRAVTR